MSDFLNKCEFFLKPLFDKNTNIFFSKEKKTPFICKNDTV